MSELSDTTRTSVTYDSLGTGGDERHSLTTYVSDLVALVRHIEVPIDRQLESDDIAKYGAAIAIISELQAVLRTQRAALEILLETLGGHPATGIKSAWSSLLGAGAAAVNAVRTTKISKSLRDDYTALGLLSISYTMLHATASGLGDSAVAALAQRHLAQITPIIVRISTSIGTVVLQELADDGEDVRVSAAEFSAQQTHAAWE
jgi:hypothetical protein